MAYVKKIDKNSSDSHQTSVGYVVTVLRWSNRDTKNYKGKGEQFQHLNTRKPLVIVSDIISLSVSSSKSSYMPSMSATLVGGDINYSTALHPGDIVLVNILENRDKLNSVYERASNLKQINKYDDGFKGIFKIQHIERRIQTSGDGTRIVSYSLQASGFTEFNNIINYNPVIASAFAGNATALFQVQIGDNFQSMIKEDMMCHSVIKILYRSLLGINSIGKSDVKVIQYGNNHFKMPTGLSELMGRKITYASDLYSLQIGVWPSSGGKTPAQGFNPGINQDKSNSTIYETSRRIDGAVLVSPESWRGQTAWSIMKSYSNEIINETYTAFKTDIKGNVSPTVIVRQKPFNKENFKSGLPITKFLSLPRWKIDLDLVFDVSTSKEESLRFNFVQVFSNGRADDPRNDQAAQIQAGNFKYDAKDIQRHGMKPYIVETNANYFNGKDSSQHPKDHRSPIWANLIADWVMGGELKEHISISFQGIEAPIVPGDNLEFEDVVYHIESVTHIYQVLSNGSKVFRTNIQGSHGVSLRSEKTLETVYSQMEHSDAFLERKENFDKKFKTMPGFSDTQDILSRKKTSGEEIPGTSDTKESSFTLKSTLREKPKKNK